MENIVLWHTSDWHLGKKFYGKDSDKEHGLFLEWFKNQIIKNKPDILVICGDIFDTSRPPTWAMKSLWDFFAAVMNESQTTILCIAGNHDSGSFLEAPESLLKNKRILVRGELKKDIQDHLYTFKKNDQRIDFTLLPYFKNHQLANLWAENEQGLTDFFEATQKTRAQNSHSVLLAHHLFGDYFPEGSELPLLSSGLSALPKSELANYFDLILLGHIHKNQVISKENPLALYSGAPMPFRFKERGKKYFFSIEFKNGKTMNPERIEVPCFRELITLNWNDDNALESYEKLKFEDSELIPYVEINLSLNSPNPKLVDKIINNWPSKKATLINLKIEYGESQKKLDKNIENLNIYDLYNHYINQKDFSEFQREQLNQDFFDLLNPPDENEQEISENRVEV